MQNDPRTVKESLTVDPLTRAVRCEKCGEWWHQGATHQCKMNWRNNPKKVSDYDIWYKPCTKCGYDTGPSTAPASGGKRCWRCGEFVQRDFSDRALKIGKKVSDTSWRTPTPMSQNDAIHQLDEAVRDGDRRIAELEAQISKLSTEATLLRQMDELLADIASRDARIAELTYERDRAIAWLESVGIGLSFEVVPADASNKEGK